MLRLFLMAFHPVTNMCQFFIYALSLDERCNLIVDIFTNSYYNIVEAQKVPGVHAGSLP
jgi:hypothetical protein